MTCPATHPRLPEWRHCDLPAGHPGSHEVNDSMGRVEYYWPAAPPAPRPVHVLHYDRPTVGVGTTYSCDCGLWEAWATGPTSTARVKAEWREHAGLAPIAGQTVIDADEGEDDDA